MTANSEKLAHHDADYFNPVGNFDSGNFFNSQHVGHFVEHTCQIINTIGIRYIGMPRLSLTHFFSTPVMKSYIGYNFYNIFTVELKYQPQQAMRARMLWSDIQKHEI